MDRFHVRLYACMTFYCFNINVCSNSCHDIVELLPIRHSTNNNNDYMYIKRSILHVLKWFIYIIISRFSNSGSFTAKFKEIEIIQ